ncbi:hypothetical protein [Legionella sp. 31fI33]|uniref:hypothetical protein n=1 Tax=Legionella sp. 31fI33 TaxID=2886376 RepID=UPI001E5925A4|nr:hypothetical protein [Legionella sp. 31fI33]MCC5015798.1 hypothetical protein [Legionella sp. 31fI33]
MSNLFFNQNGLPVYGKLLQQNEITTCMARLRQAHQALQQLKEDIDKRCEKLQGVFDFLDSKQALYQQLTEQYQQNPTASLALRINKLGQAISDLLGKLEASQPEKVIADLSSHYEELKAALAIKEALILKSNPETTQTYELVEEAGDSFPTLAKL